MIEEKLLMGKVVMVGAVRTPIGDFGGSLSKLKPTDLIKGEMAVACITLKPKQNATEEEIISFCRDNLANYKAPRYVRFLDKLPKTFTGKFEKVSLRKKMDRELLEQK